MTAAPHWANKSATRLLPEPIPPVRPILYTAAPRLAKPRMYRSRRQENTRSATCQKRAERVLSARPKRLLPPHGENQRSEEHTSELKSLMRNSYAVFCLKKKKRKR